MGDIRHAEGCRRRAREAHHRSEGQYLFAARDLPTFAAIAGDWLAGMRDRAKSTVKFYTDQIEDHLLPAFGPLRVDRISSQAVEKFRNEKRDGGLRPGTVNSLMQRLTSILNYAVKHQYIRRNPAVSTLVEAGAGAADRRSRGGGDRSQRSA